MGFSAIQIPIPPKTADEGIDSHYDEEKEAFRCQRDFTIGHAIFVWDEFPFVKPF